MLPLLPGPEISLHSRRLHRLYVRGIIPCGGKNGFCVKFDSNLGVRRLYVHFQICGSDTHPCKSAIPRGEMNPMVTLLGNRKLPSIRVSFTPKTTYTGRASFSWISPPGLPSAPRTKRRRHGRVGWAYAYSAVTPVLDCGAFGWRNAWTARAGSHRLQRRRTAAGLPQMSGGRWHGGAPSCLGRYTKRLVVYRELRRSTQRESAPSHLCE